MSEVVQEAMRADTPHIYALLHDAKFHNLPEYSKAKPVLEQARALILKRAGKVVVWASFSGEGEVNLDLVIAPNMPRNLLTKGLCKYVLAYGLKLSQAGRIKVEAYNPKGVKACLLMGFNMDESDSKDGWVRLVLTKDDFERKFCMSGKPIRP